MYSSHHQEFLRKKRQKKIARIIWVLIIFIALISLASYLSHRPKVRIARVELNGGVLVTQEEVAAVVRQRLAGSYLWLFPKNNILWYPRAGLENYLKQTFQRIDTIHISLQKWNTLAIDITERKPVATWCGETVPTGIMENGLQETCYFLDSNSTIFAEAPQFSGDAYFKYYGPVASGSPIGKQYLASTMEFAGISDFVQTTRDLGFHPLYITSVELGEFILVMQNGGKILFDTKEPMPIVAQNLTSLLKTPALSNATPDKLPIDYIDLRFGNKLFYKLK